MGTMLSNHDIFAGERAWDQFGGDMAAYRLAAATYLLLPGTPFIYYGEEVGMASPSGLAGDEPLRSPMSWRSDIRGFSQGKAFRPVSPNAATHNAATEAQDPASILAFYKAILKLRNSHHSLERGNYEAAAVDGRVLSFQRRLGRALSVVVINYGESRASVQLRGLPALKRLKAPYPSVSRPARQVDLTGGLPLSLHGQSITVLDLVER